MKVLISRVIVLANALVLVNLCMAQVGLQQGLSAAQYHELKLNGAIPSNFHGPIISEPLSGPVFPPQGMRGGGSTNTCDCWIPPDGSYTLAMPPNDDGSSALITLPFSFDLYGQFFTDCYINNNGNVSFNNSYFTFSSDPFPSTDYVMVAPFWGDVDTQGAGQVWYKVTPTALYVNWVGVGYFASQTDKLNTFQLIITDGTDPVIGIGKNVSFCYQDMQWTTGSASDGVNGFGGTPATVGANLGNGVDYIQFGRFDQPGGAYDGPFGSNDGIDWLDNQSLAFNTSVFTNNIPPIGSGEYLCDTIVVCAGELVTLDFQFLSPEADQITTATASAPDFSNFTITSNTPGQTANITGEFTPLPGEVGFHTVTFEATDNGAPPLTSTYNIVVEVQVAAIMEPGDTTVCETATPFAMYDLLGGSPLTGGDWTDPNGDVHNGTFEPGEDPDGEYVYAVGSGGNCPNTGVVTVTTVALANAGNNAVSAYCSSAPTVSLFDVLNGAPQIGGAWTAPSGLVFGGTLDPATDADGDYTYTLTGTSPCPNVSAVVTVSIEQAVDAGEDSSITLCKDADPLVLLSALNGTPENTGTWAAPGGAAFGNSFTAATHAPGNYTYTVAAVLPCPTESSVLTIAVDPLPNAGTDGQLSLCADANEAQLFPELGGNPNSGGEWIDPQGNENTGTLAPALEISGNYQYVVVGTGTCQNLTDTAFVQVDVYPMPIITFTADPDSGCTPLTVTFTNTTDPQFIGTSCLWDLGDGTSDLNECGSFEHIYEEADWYNVSLRITSPQGCESRYTKEGAVLADPAPTAEFTWTPDPGTEGNTTLLFSALDPYASAFSWDIAGLATSDQRQIAHTFENALSGSYEICLNVADRYGCVDTLCQTAEVVIPAVYIPNAFTPDGNGVNDEFLPSINGTVAEDHELMIFDRWGQMVFHSTDLEEGWNGGLNNAGEVLPSGLYNWRLVERPVGSADKVDRFGHITLLK
ncbi:MAG: gliding motility-associated C-terminal domain-containing protein [Flavobacteriales bacterium]|nr:gliding motility-associated C-terminal domain-containing protein [Flavobacteriales bacterium]